MGKKKGKSDGAAAGDKKGGSQTQKTEPQPTQKTKPGPSGDYSKGQPQVPEQRDEPPRQQQQQGNKRGKGGQQQSQMPEGRQSQGALQRDQPPEGRQSQGALQRDQPPEGRQSQGALQRDQPPEGRQLQGPPQRDQPPRQQQQQGAWGGKGGQQEPQQRDQPQRQQQGNKRGKGGQQKSQMPEGRQSQGALQKDQPPEGRQSQGALQRDQPPEGRQSKGALQRDQPPEGRQSQGALQRDQPPEGRQSKGALQRDQPPEGRQSQGALHRDQPPEGRQSQGPPQRDQPPRQQQQQSAWGGKGGQQESQQRQPQQQVAWGGKGSQQQLRQPEGRQSQESQQRDQPQRQQQPQGAWGGKGGQQPQSKGSDQPQLSQDRPQQQQSQGQQPERQQHDKSVERQQPAGRGRAQMASQSERQQPAGRGRAQMAAQSEQQPVGRGKKIVVMPEQFVEQPKELKQGPSVTNITSGIADISVKSSGSGSNLGVSLLRGTRGRAMTVETNYLELNLNQMKDIAYQYDIKFDPDKPKRFLRAAFIQYCKAVKIPNGGLAFDGKANVYSPRKLGPQYLTPCEVKVVEQESNQEKMFKVTLTETKDPAIELHSLKTYQKDRIFDKPMRALQCLDVILSSPCHDKGVRGGRSFYNPPSDGRRIDLSESYELWLGLFQAAVLGDRPFLNIDISHRAFPSAVPLLKVIDSLAGRDGHNLKNPIPQWLSNALQDYLRGLVVIYTPPKSFNSVPKRYKFQSVKAASDRQEFTIDGGRKITVAQYFKEKNYPLYYPTLPCIHVGNSIKTNYVPVEFCEVAAGQLNLKKAGPRQVAAMIKYAATPTDVRKDKILKQFDYIKHNQHDTLRHFGVGVGSQFIKVDARVLQAPFLEYNQQIKIEPRNGSWNGAEYIKSATIIEWAILNLDERTHENSAREFGNMIVSAGRKIKMNISDRFALSKTRDDRVDEELRKFKQQNKSIVFVIISGRQQNSYAKVKQNAEIRHGVLTQCIKPDTIAKRLNTATLQNILLKVNAKLNGFNHRIHASDSTIIMKNKNVMFIGADVTHPTPDQRSIPSVVGVVASHDLDGFQYNMKYALQDPTKEIIIYMEEITLHHLNVYEKFNNKLPEVIIYYRDGVSEGQFPHITNTELRAMDAAFSKKKTGYRPKLTCLIVQKRHHTRFFPQNKQGVGRYNNVPPGTIVDKTITHPNECQFFLVSHESIQGTAKPTKYCVIRDDSQFNIDDLQAITYNMCHMFARCNRTVSYPAPAYYAHHGASRGKIYIEGQNLNMKDLQKETRNREIKSEIVGAHPMFFV